MRERLTARIPRYVLNGVLGTWFAATLITQDPLRRFKGAHKFDRNAAFIPDFRFFAPRPGTHDYHLLSRDELADGSLTAWREVGKVEGRRLLHLFWHPNRRAEKILTDAVSGLIAFQEEKGGATDVVQVTMPYLTALNFVNHQVEHHEDTKRIQFLIATSGGYDESEEPMMLFLSNLHPLDRALAD